MSKVRLIWGITCLLGFAVVVSVLMRVITLDQEKQVEHPSPSKQEERILATIDNKAITYKELLEYVIRKQGAQSLNQLLDREVVKKEAGLLGITVTEEDIARELRRMQRGYESEEHFYNSIKEQLGLSKEELRDDAVHTILLERVATHNIQITEEQITSYIQSHPEEFQSQVSVHLAKILVETEKDAQDMIKLLKEGANFTDLAKEKSKDEYSRVNGGDMGWIEMNDPFIAPQILESVKEMQVQQVSNPITTDQGYVIIKLLERKEGPLLDEKNIRESVKRELALSQAPSMKEVLRNLRQKYNATVLEESMK